MQVGALRQDLSRKHEENAALLQEVSLLRKSLSVRSLPLVLCCLGTHACAQAADFACASLRHQHCLQGLARPPMHHEDGLKL
jgi:hypothetical protein